MPETIDLSPVPFNTSLCPDRPKPVVDLPGNTFELIEGDTHRYLNAVVEHITKHAAALDAEARALPKADERRSVLLTEVARWHKIARLVERGSEFAVRL